MSQRLLHSLAIVGQGIMHIRQTVDSAERHLTAANPDRLLKLGYSIVTDPTGAVVRTVSQLRHGQTVTTRLSKGAFVSEVKELKSEHE
jgi:exonuclease VII large subunit